MEHDSSATDANPHTRHFCGRSAAVQSGRFPPFANP